jgi:hypothetical protein
MCATTPDGKSQYGDPAKSDLSEMTIWLQVLLYVVVIFVAGSAMNRYKNYRDRGR